MATSLTNNTLTLNNYNLSGCRSGNIWTVNASTITLVYTNTNITNLSIGDIRGINTGLINSNGNTFRFTGSNLYFDLSDWGTKYRLVSQITISEANENKSGIGVIIRIS